MARVQVPIDAGMSVRLAHALAGTVAATVSAAGSSQSDATLIAFDNNLITTASASQGVRLPSFNAGAIYIANGTAVAVFVYPPTGGKINNDTANDPVTLPAGAAGIFKAISPLDTLAVYGAVPDNSVTFAKMQDIATQRAIGRNTAGTGDPEEVTLSQILDWIGSAAQGDILYRGASNWARLGAGTSGQFLQTQGAAANPQWATSSGGLVLLASGTVTNAATLDIVLTAYTAYRGLVFVLQLVPATDGVALQCRMSTNGGSTYDAGATDYDYRGLLVSSIVAAIVSGDATGIQMGDGTIGNAAAEGWKGRTELLNQVSTALWPTISWHGVYQDNNAPARGIHTSGSGTRKAAQDTDAIRFLFSSGNIASGTYAVYGLA